MSAISKTALKNKLSDKSLSVMKNNPIGEEDIMSLLETAEELKMLCVINPVNLSNPSFKGGCYWDSRSVMHDLASKARHVPGKTATKPPYDGFVPYDQSLSKLGDGLKDMTEGQRKKRLEKIASTQKKVDETITNGWMKVIELTTPEGEKIKVLGDVDGRPYVPDYDLFATATRGKNSPRNDETLFDAKFGLGSLNDYRFMVNANIKTRFKRIHHGGHAYWDNGDVNPTKEQCLTAVIPGYDGKTPEIRELTSRREVIDFYKEMAESGFKMPANSNWNLNLSKDVADSIDVSKSRKDADKNNLGKIPVKRFCSWQKERTVFNGDKKEERVLERMGKTIKQFNSRLSDFFVVSDSKKIDTLEGYYRNTYGKKSPFEQDKATMLLAYHRFTRVKTEKERNRFSKVVRKMFENPEVKKMYACDQLYSSFIKTRRDAERFERKGSKIYALTAQAIMNRKNRSGK